MQTGIAPAWPLRWSQLKTPVLPPTPGWSDWTTVPDGSATFTCVCLMLCTHVFCLWETSHVPVPQHKQHSWNKKRNCRYSSYDCKNNNRLAQPKMGFYHHQDCLHANMNEPDLNTPYSLSMWAVQPAGLRSAVISVSVCLTVKMSHNCSIHPLAVRRLLCLQEFFPQNYLNLTGFHSCILVPLFFPNPTG